jgi:membrane-associated phospholipid phosphatase
MVRFRYFWVGVILLASFFTLGILVRSKPTSFDLIIAQFFALYRTHQEIGIANFVSTTTAPIVVGLVAIGILAFWFYKRTRKSVYDLVPIALIIAAGAASTLAKPIFHRVRPGMNLSTVFDAEPSFPSSHTVFIAVVGSTLLFILPRDV